MENGSKSKSPAPPPQVIKGPDGLTWEERTAKLREDNPNVIVCMYLSEYRARYAVKRPAFC